MFAHGIQARAGARTHARMCLRGVRGTRDRPATMIFHYNTRLRSGYTQRLISIYEKERKN